MRRARRRLRRFLVTGLIVIAPVGLTVFVLSWLFTTLDDILGRPLEKLVGFPIPGVGFVLLGGAVLFVGWVVHLTAGRQLLNWWNHTLSRFPFVGRIYNVVSQIVQALLSGRKKMFDKAVLIPYPTDETWAVAFVTNDDPEIVSQAVGEPCVNVFVPTTPNPTSGFMLVVPKRKVRELDLTMDEATRLVMSAGVVLPAGDVEDRSTGLDVDSLLRRPRE